MPCRCRACRRRDAIGRCCSRCALLMVTAVAHVGTHAEPELTVVRHVDVPVGARSSCCAPVRLLPNPTILPPSVVVVSHPGLDRERLGTGLPVVVPRRGPRLVLAGAGKLVAGSVSLRSAPDALRSMRAGRASGRWSWPSRDGGSAGLAEPPVVGRVVGLDRRVDTVLGGAVPLGTVMVAGGPVNHVAERVGDADAVGLVRTRRCADVSTKPSGGAGPPVRASSGTP